MPNPNELARIEHNTGELPREQMVGLSSFQHDLGVLDGFEVVPPGTMRRLVVLAESSVDPALKAKLLAAIPEKYGGNG